MRHAGFTLLAFFALPFLAGCATPVQPTVTQGPFAPVSEEPTIVLTARTQNVRIQQSLSDAGLAPVAPASEANYQLVVDIGRSRGRYQCGILANISYTLSQRGQQILVLKGRGKTGSCEPNILDDMSRELASFFR